MKGGLETGVIKTARIEYGVVDDSEFLKHIDLQALLDTLERFLPGFKAEFNKRKIELLDRAAEELFPSRRKRAEPEEGAPVEELLEV